MLIVVLLVHQFINLRLFKKFIKIFSMSCEKQIIKKKSKITLSMLEVKEHFCFSCFTIRAELVSLV